MQANAKLHLPLRATCLLMTILSLAATRIYAKEPAVAVLYGAAWSPGDAARDGAAEFEVLMCAANLRHANPLAGIVGVGRRNGSFAPAAEVALMRVVHMGIPVVRLAEHGPLPAHGSGVFVEAGSLSPAEAKHVLAECLSRYGAPPAAADPEHPTKKESAAIEAKLALYQFQFDTRNAEPIAMN